MNKELILKELNEMNALTLMEVLDIQYTDVGEDFLEATMPVSSKVHQPYGILHGGASIALAETVGSVLSVMHIDRENFKSVGMQMTANHLRPKKEGKVVARAEFVQRGKTTHLVKVEIKDEQGKVISYCHLTTAIIPTTAI